MSSFLVFLFIIFYIILCKTRLDWAVMLIIIGLPAYLLRFSIFGIPFTVLEAMILIAFFVWLITQTKFKDFIRGKYSIKKFKENKEKRIKYPFRWEMILLLFISYWAMIMAGFTDASLGIWKAYFFEPVLFFILVLNTPLSLPLARGEEKRETPPNSSLARGEDKEGADDDNVADPLLSSPLQYSGQASLRGRDVTNVPGGIIKIVWSLCVSAFLVSVVAIIERMTGLFSVPEFWPRVTSVFPYPNAVGLYLGPIVMILIGWIFSIFNFQFSPVKRVQAIFKQYSINKFSIFQLFFVSATIILSFISIYLAKSEGAMAGIIIALVVMGLFAIIGSKPKLKWLPASLIVLAVAFSFSSTVFFLKVVPEYKYFNFDCQISNYISDKLMLKDFSGEVRKQQWRETWGMLTESPARFFFGNGLSGYQEAVKPYHQEGIFFNKDRDTDFRRKIVWFDEKYKAAHWRPVEIYMYPHNILLNFWTELGLLGTLLFIWIIGKIIVTCIKLYNQYLISNIQYQSDGKILDIRYLILGLLGAMIVIIIHGIVDVPYFKNDLAVMFWLFIAMLSLISLENKKRTRHPKNLE